MKSHFQQVGQLSSAALIAGFAIVLSAAHGQVADSIRVAQQADVAETGDDADDRIVHYPDNDEDADDDRPLAAQAEALQRRAGEQIGDEPTGRAVVLGMHVQEADNQHVKVVEVAAASPAFDAGIREGDMLVSFDGFKAETYREWIDGIQKLVTDAPEGDTMPIQLMRDGKRLNLRLRKPEAKADDPRLPIPRTPADKFVQQTESTPGYIPVQPNQPIVPGGGGGVLIDDFFDDGESSERAVAEIFRLNIDQQAQSSAGDPSSQRRARGQLGATAAGSRQAATGTTGAQIGARIGLAGFRDDQTGMMVMLDVGGLEPGNYLVGIDDPGVLFGSGSAGIGVSPGIDPRRQLDPKGPVPPQQVAPPRAIGDPTPINPQQPRSVPAPGAQPGTDGAQPQSGIPRSLRSQVPVTVLAQVANEATDPAGSIDVPSTGNAAPLDVPPTDAAPPSDVPRPGQTRPFDATPIGQPRQDVSQTQPLGTPREATAPDAVGGTLNQIGVLTVDQSGTGRMQQVVEGVHVRDVVGQAIVIYSHGMARQRALPSDLNPAADPVRGSTPSSQRIGTATTGAAAAQQAPSNAGQRIPSAQPSIGAGRSAVIAAQTSNNRRTPVAGGVIRLMSGRQSLDASAEQPQVNQPAPNDVPPSAGLPSTQEPIR